MPYKLDIRPIVGSLWKIKPNPNLAPFQIPLRYEVVKVDLGLVTFRVVGEKNEFDYPIRRFNRVLVPVNEEPNNAKR